MCRAAKRLTDGERCGDCDEPAVFEENVPAVVLLGAASTQWRRASSGHLLGLEYGGLEVCARLLRIELDPETFGRLQTLELEVIRATDEKLERAARG